MAWRCTGSSLLELVSNLQNSGIIHSEEVFLAMKTVDRADFCQSNPYSDSPQSIGYGATISAPHMHAYTLEILKDFIIRPESHILDVGSGSGYLTACIGIMSSETSKIVGIDYISELVDLSSRNMATHNSHMSDKIEFRIGDGWRGFEQEAPYDAIHVGAAAEFIPSALIDQLKPGGRMVIPVGPCNGDQSLILVDKPLDPSGKIVIKSIMGVRYVPLVQPAL